MPFFASPPDGSLLYFPGIGSAELVASLSARFKRLPVVSRRPLCATRWKASATLIVTTRTTTPCVVRFRTLGGFRFTPSSMFDFAPHFVFVAVERKAPGQDMMAKHTPNVTLSLSVATAVVSTFQAWWTLVSGCSRSLVFIGCFSRLQRTSTQVYPFRRLLASSTRASPLQAFCARCGSHAMLHGVLLVRVCCMQALSCHTEYIQYDMCL